MKNLSLVLNVVLLIAVAVLFYLQFSGAPGTVATSGPTDIKDLKVAYINSDTVLKYYDYFKINRDKLQSKGQKLDQDLKTRAQALQNEFESAQRNVGNMTISQARAVEEDLAKKRQNLQLYQESLSQEMLVEQEKMQKELYDRITSFLKKFGQETGLQVVFKYDASSDLLYGGDGLDITKVVVEGLNKSYKEEQATAPAKADSTATKKK